MWRVPTRWHEFLESWREPIGPDGDRRPINAKPWVSAMDRLADLDPDDARVLVDGSRYVDALALKLVAEEVLGG